MTVGMAMTFYMKEIIDKLDFIKLNKILLCERQCQENDDKTQTEKKYLLRTQLIKGCHPKYTKND